MVLAEDSTSASATSSYCALLVAERGFVDDGTKEVRLRMA